MRQNPTADASTPALKSVVEHWYASSQIYQFKSGAFNLMHCARWKHDTTSTDVVFTKAIQLNSKCF